MDQLAESRATLSSILATSPGHGNGNMNMRMLTELGESAQKFPSRLKSYRKWLKPSEVSPWWCSRYGWYCVEKDLLQCVDCHQYLSAHLPSTADDPSLHNKMVSRFRTSLTEAHTKTCVWRSSITSEDACAPNVTDYQRAFNDFINRLRSLSPYFPSGSEKQYNIDESIFDEKAINESAILDMIELVKASDANPPDVSMIICIMALLGWKADESCRECVSCEYCLRRLGLWLFRISSSSEAGASSAVGDLDAVQDQSPNSARRLNPIAQHHKWCPWLMAVPSVSALYSSSTEGGEFATDSVPTWLALYRLLINRGVIAATVGSPLNQGEISAHYTLARQLLDETINLLDDTDFGGDGSGSYENLSPPSFE